MNRHVDEADQKRLTRFKFIYTYLYLKDYDTMIALDIEDVNVNECFAVKLRNLFNLNDFLYSFLFGFVPSLADIVTDFTFTSRLAKNSFILIAQG